MKSFTEYVQGILQRAPVVGEHLVLEEKGEHPGTMAPSFHMVSSSHSLPNSWAIEREETSREDRRAERVHAVGVDVPEGVEMAQADLRAQAVLEPPGASSAAACAEWRSGSPPRSPDRPRKRHVERLGGQVLELLAGPVPELHVLSA